MNKEQYLRLVDKLVARDYIKPSNSFSHADYYWYKTFHKKDNKWDNKRSAYQIFLYVYDYTVRTYRNNDYYDRLPKETKSKVEVEAHVCISRTINERLDLTFAVYDNDNIENLEQIAEAFYTSMCNLLPTPREEGPVYDTER